MFRLVRGKPLVSFPACEQHWCALTEYISVTDAVLFDVDGAHISFVVVDW